MITSGIVTLYVTDMERAVEFYTDTLGLEEVYRGGPSWTVVQTPDGFRVGLHDAMGESVGVSGSTTLGFRVDGALPDVVDELSARGVDFVGEITQDTAVPLAYFQDPDGNQMYLVEQGGGHG